MSNTTFFLSVSYEYVTASVGYSGLYIHWSKNQRLR